MNPIGSLFTNLVPRSGKPTDRGPGYRIHPSRFNLPGASGFGAIRILPANLKPGRVIPCALSGAARARPLQAAGRRGLTRPGRPSGPEAQGAQAVQRVLSLLALLVLLVAGTQLATAAPLGTISAGFDSANKLYEQGKFSEAAAAYEELLKSGVASPAIYFNLGNAYFKSGRIGNAIAAYREAERVAPRDPDVRANLRFVRNQIQGPTLLPDRWHRWLGRLSVNEWTVLASVVFWLWLLLLAARQCRPAWKQSLRTAALSSGLAAAVLVACLGAVLLMNSRETGVVIAEEAVVRNGPLDESPTAYVVHDGAELNILDRKDDWYQVSAGDRRVGWLKREQVLVESQSQVRPPLNQIRL